MTTIDDRPLEDRLRDDLPELADLMIAGGVPGRVPDAPRRSRRVWPAVAAAFVLIAGVVGAIAATREDDDSSVQTTPTPTTTVDATGFGSWRRIADAPIDLRSFPVSAWTGDQAIFWAGSNPERNLAHSDGAAYDPVTDTWREIPVPGWGHPGMASAVLDGQLYALAKNGGARFDFETEEWSALPEIEGMSFQAAVATDDAVYGLGLLETGAGEIYGLARLDADANRWIPDVDGEFGRNGLEGDALWTGSEIQWWNRPDGPVTRFDPTSESWGMVPSLQPPAGRVVGSRPVVTDAGLVALVDVEDGGVTRTWMARMVQGEWDWLDLDLPVAPLDRATVVAAGDWLVVFHPDAHPTVIHAATGRSEVVVDGPLGGLDAPGAVWTGEELVVWGGVGRTLEGVDDVSSGAVWTPPAEPPGAGGGIIDRDLEVPVPTGSGWTDFDLAQGCDDLRSLEEIIAAGRQSDTECIVATLAAAALEGPTDVPASWVSVEASASEIDDVLDEGVFVAFVGPNLLNAGSMSLDRWQHADMYAALRRLAFQNG